MEQKVKPSPRLAPLPADHVPELREFFEDAKQRIGFVPNSMLIMQRKPKLVKAFAQLGDAVRSDAKIDRMLISLISYVASRAAGCLYCMAHTAEGAAKTKPEKLEAVWEFRTSPLFTEAEHNNGLAGNLKFVDLPEWDIVYGYCVFLCNKAPHPNPAKLFVNWLLSPEGQAIWCKSIEFNNAGTDVPAYSKDSEATPGKQYYFAGQEATYAKQQKTQAMRAKLLG